MPVRKLVPAVLVAALAAVSLTACGSSAGSGETTLVVATHDSWAMPKATIAAFEKAHHVKVRIEEQGDGGELTNKLVLTKGSPIADVAYGVDNTFASRAVDAGVFAKDAPTDQPASAARFDLAGDSGTLAPVDYSDVCVNIDDSWFAKKHLTPPKTLDDLTKPAYKGLFVTPGATTSSPGLAFLLATIAAKGSAWPSYWKALMANGAKIDQGWDDAWNVDYTAGGGHGSRPIVLSYSSSPPDTVPKGGTKPTTSALLDTCFRQVEYAGVLAGTKHVALARDFVSFLQSVPAQRTMPENMYVYPVNSAATLPADWKRWAPAATSPYTIAPDQITAHRDSWLSTWRDIATG